MRSPMFPCERTWLQLAALTLALTLGGCDRSDDDDDTTPASDDDDDDTTPADDDDDTTPADDDDAVAHALAGTYVVGFQRDGSQFALGSFVVAADGTWTADVAASGGFKVEAAGTAEEDGSVEVDSVTNNAGLDIQILTAAIHATGTLDGTYSVDDEEGMFAGSRDNAFTEGQLNAAFDGSYELTTLLDGEETASTVFFIEAGRFEVQILDIFDQEFVATGFVTSDGTVVLNTLVSGDGYEMMAEGSIDQETFELSGLWRKNDIVGQITGRRSD
jgi:hypothetical protein